MRTLVAYLPVIHAGVVEMLSRHISEIDQLVLINGELACELGGVSELRALPADMAVAFLRSYFPSVGYQVLDPTNLESLRSSRLIVGNDLVGRTLVDRHYGGADVQFDTTFIHYDAASVHSSVPLTVDRTVSVVELDEMMVKLARQEASWSPCWWRQVGAVAWKDSKVLGTGHNSYQPTEHTGYAVGDRRDFIKAGTDSDNCNSNHAERALVGDVMVRGGTLVGASVLVTAAPCETCAIQLTLCKISRVYFMSGGAYLGIDELFKAHGIEMIAVRS